MTAGCSNKETEELTSPNIIYILADDLGYGDLSCYGQTKFSTPNIDQLAAEGIRFTQHYSGATVCAPSRSALMTGLHTGHTPIRGNKSVQPEGQYPLADSITTLTEVLKTVGYATGTFGKWGLGPPGSEGAPENQGIDQFFGYNCQRLAHNYYPRHLWNNDRKVFLPENNGDSTGTYAPDLIHEQAISFIEKNRRQPFFLFYAAVIPHAELVAPEPYMEKFRGKFDPEHAYQGYDEGPNYREGPYGSQPESHAAFAAMINHLDDCVGSIMDKLKELGIDDNTLVIFTSDNGPHLEGGADPDYFNSNGIYRGFKRDLYEGGIRVPMIAHWPGKISPGKQTDHPSAFWDVMPTVIELTGAAPVPNIDGLSFAPTLMGMGDQPKHQFMYWEFHEKGGRRALRQGPWKLVQYQVGSPEHITTELFNIEEDPSETVDRAESREDLVRELTLLMEKARTPSPVFRFADEQYMAK
ncbi:MAG: arylsulfatase [Cyclobacteriaceae bacterium]|nr:MAG: arylsulfatase [Cyclobacteriaceae bacterium]